MGACGNSSGCAILEQDVPAYKKPAQKRRRLRASYRSNDIVGVVLLFLLGLFVVLVGFLVWKLYSSWENRLWGSTGRLTVVVATDDPSVYSYSPEAGQLVVFKIPKDTQVDAAMGYGSWPVGGLWRLGDQEGKAMLLAHTLQKSLGVPVDAWMGPAGEDLFSSGSLSLFPALVRALPSPGQDTNLTYFDRLHLALAVGKVGLVGRNEVDLTISGVLRKGILGDGVEGYLVVPERITDGLEFLKDDKVFFELKTVRVVNASGKSGVAGEVSRVLAVMGLRVVSVDTGKQELKEVCIVKAKGKDRESYSYHRLLSVYGCVESVEGPSGFASLEIVLGENFGEQY